MRQRNDKIDETECEKQDNFDYLLKQLLCLNDTCMYFASSKNRFASKIKHSKTEQKGKQRNLIIYQIGNRENNS